MTILSKIYLQQIGIYFSQVYFGLALLVLVDLSNLETFFSFVYLARCCQKSCPQLAPSPCRMPSSMSWRVKHIRCARRNCCSRTRSTMALWKIYCWAWKASHIEGQTRWGDPNADASTIIACRERWRRWTARLVSWLAIKNIGAKAKILKKKHYIIKKGFKKEQTRKKTNESINFYEWIWKNAICDWAI